MGREAMKMKDRKCKHCGKPMLMTAKQLVAHQSLCKRASAAGLILPGSVDRV